MACHQDDEDFKRQLAALLPMLSPARRAKLIADLAINKAQIAVVDERIEKLEAELRQAKSTEKERGF